MVPLVSCVSSCAIALFQWSRPTSAPAAYTPNVLVLALFSHCGLEKRNNRSEDMLMEVGG